MHGKPPEDVSGKANVDPEAFARNLARLMDEGGRAMAAYMKPREDGTVQDEVAEELADVTKTLGQVAEYWLSDPQRAIEAQSSLVKGYLDLWTASMKRMAGEEVKPVATPAAADRRFTDPEWSQNPFFDAVKQAYLITSDWAARLVRDAEGLDPHTRQKADFYVKQIAAAISPSNFVFTNPLVLRETLASNGENLVRGMKMLTEDIEAGHGELKLRQSDASKFEIGRNLALSSGKVVFENELMQLIQYAPSTGDVLRIPVLLVPPWINKFYVLDLTPDKSFIKWMVDQGLTVFVVSWVNPDAHLASKSFEDYMRDGVFAALDAVETVTGELRVHAMGYCVGGTLLATALGYMAAKKDDRFASATFLATQVDFTYAGDLKVFVDEDQIKVLERKMQELGFMEGEQDGFGVQHAARQRPDLALHREQLSARQGALPVRPAVLEFGFDAAAGGQPFVLSAQLLSGEQAVARPDDDRQRQDRSRQNMGPDLSAGHARGPHRAGAIGVPRLASVRRADAVRARGLRPYRRRRQSSGPAEVSILDRRRAQGRAQELDEEGRRASGLLVARLARVDRAARFRARARARARRRQAQADRGRAGEICASEGLSHDRV